jgi:quercetin dioxygenase-like cupin family protein
MFKENATDSAGATDELQVLTDRVRVLTSGKATGGRYELFEYTASEDGVTPPHQHPWDEDYFVLDGGLDLGFNGVTRSYGRGESVRIAAGTAHTFKVRAGGARFLMVASPSAVGAFFQDLDGALRSVRLNEAEVGRIAAIHKVQMVAP